VSWDSVRLLKDSLLKAQIVRLENRALREQDSDVVDPSDPGYVDPE